MKRWSIGFEGSLGCEMSQTVSRREGLQVPASQEQQDKTEAINDERDSMPIHSAAGSTRDGGPGLRPAHEVPLPDDDVDLDDPFQRKRALLDSVPLSIKRQRYQDNTAGASQLPLLVMHSVAQTTGESRFGAEQLKGMGKLMTKKVVGVKIHGVPRRRLYDHERHRGCNRLTLMMSEDGRVKARDDDKRNKEKMHDEWVGLTVFYKNGMENLSDKKARYLYTPLGLLKVPLNKKKRRMYVQCMQHGTSQRACTN